MNRGDLAELTAFVSVADRLSFRAAASQLGVTPSAKVPATLRALIDMIRTVRGAASARRSLQNPFTKN
jgi:DNA-binding transcriptional LysR family regulator